MPLTAADVRAAHAALAPVDDLVAERRTLYRALGDLAAQPTVPADDVDLLDNPMERGRLATLFAGSAPVEGGPSRLTEIVADGYATPVAGGTVRLASAATAPGLLGPAVARIHRVLDRHGDTDSHALLTDRARLAAALAVIVEGVRLAGRAAEDLAADLLPHVALFAVTDRTLSGRLGSASAREFPGLVVLPEPVSAAEAAEAFVHEGAHQKFFDLAITRSVLEDGHWTAAEFTPSWARVGAPRWSLEQGFAAWHAYTCLAVLGRGMAGSGTEPAPGSLLPHAAERAAEIGSWLTEAGRFIAPDGQRLLGALLGREPVDTAAPPPPVAAPTLATYRCRLRSLVVRDGSPPELFWISNG